MSNSQFDRKPDSWIPNIILGQDYDQRYLDSPIHYDELENLAGFFGHNMPVHRHAQYLQIHYINRGDIDFHIDDKVYHVQGPACFFTPSSVPHSFQMDSTASGHVLTIHQSLVWGLIKEGLIQEFSHELNEGICIAATDLQQDLIPHWTRLTDTLDSIRTEWHLDLVGKQLSLDALVRLAIISIARLANRKAASLAVHNEDLRQFHRFTDLVEEHYKTHWQLPQYTEALGISESRLNQLCQKISNCSPKKLILDRLTQEAKRLLTFSTLTSKEICYELGFTDPAYFSRFFKRSAGVTAHQFRRDNTNP